MFPDAVKDDEESEAALPTHADLVRGVPAAWAETLIKSKLLSREDVARVIPIRTLNRRVAERQPLTLREGDALARLVRIVRHARDAFDDPAVADAWLRSANPALGGDMPIVMASSDAGARQAEDVLARFEAGVFG